MARDKKMTLTEKQKRFIDEYLIDMNASAAARRAIFSNSSQTVCISQSIRRMTAACSLSSRICGRF